MSTVEDLLASTQATGDPAVDGPTVKDGRYHHTHPVTGKLVRSTRATNFTKLLADTYRIQQWEKRMVLLGAAMRPDITARAVAAGAEDRDALDKLAAEAKEVAGGNRGANLGSAMHDLTDRLDRGEEVACPAPMDADLRAYREALDAHGVRIRRDLIEKYVCLPELEVAGKFDRIVDWDGRSVIADLKTQASMAYGWLEIAIQLALYAHAPWLWQPGTGWVPKPPVDLNEALVFHLPVGQAACRLYAVDIAAGWEAVQEADRVRGWRRRSKGLARALDVAGAQDLESLLEASLAGGGETGVEGTRPPAAPPAGDNRFLAERNAWLKDRLARALDLLGDELPPGLAWPDGVPKFRDGGPRTWDEAALVEDFCVELDRCATAPFPPERPPGPDDPFADFEPKAPLPSKPSAPPPVTPPEVRTALAARFQAIAAEDIRTAATVEAREAGVAEVQRLDAAQVEVLTRIVTAAENAWQERKSYVASRLRGWDDVEVEAFRAAVAADRTLEEFRVDDVERLDCLLDAADSGHVVFTYEIDGAVLVAYNAETALLDAAGGTRKAALDLAKSAAVRHGRPAPRSVAAAASDPVLVAVVAHPRPAGEAA